MDPRQFFSASRLLIVAGKGGVGKTTVTAAMARAAADVGLSVLVIEVEGKSGLPSAFGAPGFGYEGAELSPGVRGRRITSERALVEYLDDHGLRRISGRLAATGALDVVATAVPGIEDILVLGKVKQLERAEAADLILLDAPAAGHAVTFLQSARGLLDAVTVGPIRTQAADVMELLSDAARCRVMLVTLPEETPVNELIDTAYALEDRVGVHLAPVVVNGLDRPVAAFGGAVPSIADVERAAAAAGAALLPGEAAVLAEAAAFRAGRVALQREQTERLAKELPLPQVRLPFVYGAVMGPDQLAVLAASVLDALTDVPELAGR